MIFKGLITAAAAVALAAAPTVAAAQSASELAPAFETVSGSALQGRGDDNRSDNRGVSNRPFPFVAIAAILAAGFGLCVAFNICFDDDNELPVSPG